MDPYLELMTADKTNQPVWYLAINPLNAELNPICHLLALLGAHHILHVSKMRVKHTTFSYVYNLY